MTVYIIVRNTEDSEFNTVDVFQGVYGTVELVDSALNKLQEDFPEETFEVLERIISTSNS